MSYLAKRVVERLAARGRGKYTTLRAAQCVGFVSLVTLLPIPIHCQTAADVNTTSTDPYLSHLGINWDDDATSWVRDLEVFTSTTLEDRTALLAAATADAFHEDVTAAATAHKQLESPGEKALAASKAASVPPPLTSIPMKQPTGSLSGKIVFCSAGHGWTCDDTSTTLWYTQRPSTSWVVEDFGNLDQMNLFADMCIRAGATVVPMRPVGFQTIERVIDNDSSQASFQGEWRDSKSEAFFGFDGARVPYRFAIARMQETAVARFRPHIPKSDYYPIYCWARDGADRVNQTYRIVHNGGSTDFQINHRQVGKGWVYLGEYYLAKGLDCYVDVTNQISDPADADGQHVVIADAIRFGNGLGDVNRGGGVSDRPREEEANRYWTERALPASAPPIFKAFEGSDQRTNVGSAPRLAAYMNREREGSYFDRVFLSFHSNAAGGRGVVGLFNEHEQLRPDKQVEWAQLLASSLNEEMTSRGLDLPVPWVVRNKLTDSHIDFGEIRRDAIHNEMVASITEVAFHDNPMDAELLRDPEVRLSMAEASLRATLRYMDGYSPASSERYVPPASPRMLSVRSDVSTNSATVVWAAPDSDGESTPTAYRVCHSFDGRAFDSGRVTTDATQMRFDDLTTGTHYFTVTSIGPGGDSRPSLCAGTARFHAKTEALLLCGFGPGAFDEPLTQTAPANIGAPLKAGAEFVRIIPRLLDRREQVPTWGNALAASNVGFDSVTATALAQGDPGYANYDAVIAAFGNYREMDSPLDEAQLSTLADYHTSGGAILFSGSFYPAALAEEGTGTLEAGRELADLLAFEAGELSTGPLVIRGAASTVFSTYSLSLAKDSIRNLLPRNLGTLEPAEEAVPILMYADEHESVAGAAIADSPDRAGSVVLTFALEEVTPEDRRTLVMRDLLPWLGIQPSTTGPAVVKKKVQPVLAKRRATSMKRTKKAAAKKSAPKKITPKKATTKKAAKPAPAKTVKKPMRK